MVSGYQTNRHQLHEMHVQRVSFLLDPTKDNSTGGMCANGQTLLVDMKEVLLYKNMVLIRIMKILARYDGMPPNT